MRGVAFLTFFADGDFISKKERIGNIVMEIKQSSKYTGWDFCNLSIHNIT